MNGKFFIISGIQGDYNDVSLNMINYISASGILFVEDINEFNNFILNNKINFNGELVQLTIPFNLHNYKEFILKNILMGKNIGIFETSGTACFIDPGFEIVSYIYDLKKQIEIEIIPVPGTSALTLAISMSGFNIVNFKFLGFLSENTMNDVLTSNMPVIYFNRIRDYFELEKNINFMKNISNRYVFVGINLGKKGTTNCNKLIRGKYNEVYNELDYFYKNNKISDDITFIFK